MREKGNLLLAELRPEVGQTEDLLEEDVEFGASPRPLVELIHHVDVRSEVSDGLDSEQGARRRVHPSLPVLVARVVRRRLPDGH